MRGQLVNMTEQDRRNYRSIVLRKWKEFKGDLKRLIKYNNKAKQMKDESEKVILTTSEDNQHDPPVGHVVHPKDKVTEKSVVKKNTETTKITTTIFRIF